MVGGEENLATMHDWGAPSPSPRSFFSSLLKDGISAISSSNDNRKQWSTSLDAEGIQNGSEGFGAGNNLSVSKGVEVQKPSSRNSFSERMAARGGFNAPSLDIAKASGLSTSHQDTRTSYLTIPTGLSPTTLLESPVFLSNSLAQQSPTTGQISSELFGEKRSRPTTLSKDQPSQGVNSASFAFKPHPGPSRPQLHRLAAPVNCHQPRSNIEVSVLPVRPAAAQNLDVVNSQQRELHSYQMVSDDIKKNGHDLKSIEAANNDTELKRQSVGQEDMGDDYKGEYYSTLIEAPSEDGYNWRKYGQKQVKGSEFPRSYYKCTHPDCPVKKKVERSREGHITEIIYKGAHNHSKPQASRRSAIGSSSHLLNDQQQSIWAPGEVTSAAQAGEFNDHAAIDVSSAESNDEDDDECVSQRAQDDEDDESDSKRRKVDSCVTEMSGASRSIREPRVVVQTTSEVDILDDGYKWRKYGQKVVKGNPNPRSYYKCTNAGCNVRKHVERASHDLKAVITTYEGKHNHDVPAAKSHSHTNSAASSLSSVSSTPFVPRPDPLLGRQMLRPSSGFSFSVGQQNLSNLAMGCLGSGPQSKMPSMQMHQTFYDNQGRGNGLGLMLPKEEPKEPAPYTSNIPVGSSIYHQLMSRLPL